MIDYQTVAAILFIGILTFFLIKNRSNITMQKIAFPFLYFVMYKSKFGLGFMDSVAKKLPRIVRWSAYAGIITGFLGMALIAFSLIQNLINLILTPAASAGVALVLPFKVKGSFYVPFFYWIISIFVLAVIHEFSHGVVARANGVKIKSSGFAFLGVLVPILPAAFVEPDDEEMKKKSDIAKLSVYAAGPFANIAFAAFVALLFYLIFAPLSLQILEPSGIEVAGYVDGNTTYPVEAAGISIGEVIVEINGINVSDASNFTYVLQNMTKPGDEVTVKTNVSEYSLSLAENPDDKNSSYLGIYVKQRTDISRNFVEKYGYVATASMVWLIGLFYWFYVLNLGIGLFNLVPLGPIDGGRMLHTILLRWLREDIATKIWKYTGTIFLFIIFASIVFAFVK